MDFLGYKHGSFKALYSARPVSYHIDRATYSINEHQDVVPQVCLEFGDSRAVNFR
jgi:hypothetical protein